MRIIVNENIAGSGIQNLRFIPDNLFKEAMIRVERMSKCTGAFRHKL